MRDWPTDAGQLAASIAGLAAFHRPHTSQFLRTGVGLPERRTRFAPQDMSHSMPEDGRRMCFRLSPPHDAFDNRSILLRRETSWIEKQWTGELNHHARKTYKMRLQLLRRQSALPACCGRHDGSNKVCKKTSMVSDGSAKPLGHQMCPAVHNVPVEKLGGSLSDVASLRRLDAPAMGVETGAFAPCGPACVRSIGASYRASFSRKFPSSGRAGVSRVGE